MASAVCIMISHFFVCRVVFICDAFVMMNRNGSAAVVISIRI